MTDERFQLYDPEGRRKYLTAQERGAFLATAEHAPREVRILCLVLAYTVCRISEARSLSTDRVVRSPEDQDHVDAARRNAG